ncbi:MAG: NADPH dehydrogenase NamA [Anaerovoracaceae bacterium]|jgi:NADPH2 dehydrogenase
MHQMFNEYKIKNLTLKNRIVMPPMDMYCAPESGISTKWHTIHYATRAIGGTGLIIVETTAVSPEGRISSNDLGLWDDAHIEGLAEIVDMVHECGAKISIQLNHAGRKCEAKGMDVEAPSALAYEEGSPIPREMSKEDIAQTVEEFKAAAARAHQAGFDMLQIHGAHGYLINEFLSPLTNRRTDEYGGSHENRVRFLGEIIDAVRTVWPWEKPLEVRVTAEDYQEGGNLPEDLAKMINLVKDKGLDAVNVSTGGLVPVVPKVFPGYQVPHAELIKKETGLPVTAGGLITNGEEVESIISEGKAELVYLGRELLRNPYWVLETAHKMNVDIEWPKQYERGKWRKK